MRKIVVLLLCVTLQVQAKVGNLVSPLDIPNELSANYAELRANHFHSGLDFKTQQQTGLPIYAVAAGYVSRISVSAGGYGHCLYITHPQLGISSVYAHLDAYYGAIDSVVRARQYQEKQFEVDFNLEPNELVVQQGQRVATSGNTGGSGGPHLHFELRNTANGHSFNPMDYFEVNDLVRPRFRGVQLCPLFCEGMVNRSSKARYYQVDQPSVGKYRIAGGAKVKAWGKIGVATRVNDYMTGTANVYGVRSLLLRVDGDTVSYYLADELSFDSTRYINALIQYDRWYQNSEMWMKTYTYPNYYHALYRRMQNQGYIDINEVRDYKVELTAGDSHGNFSTLSFIIQGDSCSIPHMDVDTNGVYYLWNQCHNLIADNYSFYLPDSALYRSQYIKFSEDYDSLSYGGPYHIGSAYEPLQKAALLRVKVQNDTLPNKSKYYLARNARKGGYENVGAVYKDGFLEAKTRQLGVFTVKVDTVPPRIRPLSRSSLLRLSISDNQSGISSYCGTVDGQWALFEYDAKNNLLFYRFDAKRVTRGKSHRIEVKVLDRCGNEGVLRFNQWY